MVQHETCQGYKRKGCCMLQSKPSRFNRVFGRIRSVYNQKFVAMKLKTVLLLKKGIRMLAQA